MPHRKTSGPTREHRIGATISCILLIFLTCAQLLVGQETETSTGRSFTLRYYHGSDIESGWIKHSEQGGYYRVDNVVVPEAYRAVGEKLCIVVHGANTLHYSYSLGIEVDSTTKSVPEFGPIELLAELLDTPTGDPPTRDDSDLQPSTSNLFHEIRQLVRRGDSLAADINKAQQYLDDSDRPEPLRELHLPDRATTAGLRYAFARIASLPSDSGRFNDSRLKESHDAWVARATQRVRADAELVSTVRIVAGYLARLRDHRGTLKARLASARSAVTLCEEVGEGPTTFDLQIASRDTVMANRRLTGDPVATVKVAPERTRPLFSVVPVAFASHAPDVPEFFSEDGHLRVIRRDGFAYRVGTMFTVRLGSRTGDVTYGIGLGLGTRGEEEVLSDFFVAALAEAASVRIGLGIGRSSFPDTIPGLKDGDELERLEDGQLQELIQNAHHLALYLVFALPGLGL